MSQHLFTALDKLKRSLLKLAALAEEQLHQSMNALGTLNKTLSQEVISRDRLVDEMEVEVEEESLQILALYQPVAFDLRFVVMVLKMTNDLERIADYANNIAERAIFLADNHLGQMPIDYSEMASRATKMLRTSIDALIQRDAKLARSVMEADADVDKIHAANFKALETQIKKDPQKTALYLQVLSVSRYLERIADLATNISEDIVYLVEGRIVRHHLEERKN